MKTTAENRRAGEGLSSYQIPSSAISIPSNFIFFKSLCGGESLHPLIKNLAGTDYIYCSGNSHVEGPTKRLRSKRRNSPYI